GDRRVELGLGQAVINERSTDVLIPREFGVETEADIDQRLDAAVNDDGAPGRRKIAGDQFEQCRLAGAVSADDAEPLAAPNRERHVLQRRFVVMSRFAPKAQTRQPEYVKRLLGRAVVE